MRECYKIGLVFQKPVFFEWKSVLENVALPAMISGRSDAITQASRYLGEFHLDSASGSFPHELSGGMLARAALARALVIEQNRRFFQSEEEVPQCVITMGVGTILEAQRILLLASGEKKTRAVTDAIEGHITASRTGSALQLHKDVTVVVVLDKDAGRWLSNAEYYRRVSETTSKVTPGRLW